MAILLEIEVLEHNLFVTRDARDPLGIWTARAVITGDASGTPIVMRFLAAQTNRVYTCHAVTMSSNGSVATYLGLVRLLTNFPPATPAGGAAGYSYNRVFSVVREPLFDPPEDNINAASSQLLNGTEKLLLWGPTPAFADVSIPIVEMQINENTLAATYFLEVWGYYWDKVAVLNAAGGPRFPGSS